MATEDLWLREAQSWKTERNRSFLVPLTLFLVDHVRGSVELEGAPYFPVVGQAIWANSVRADQHVDLGPKYPVLEHKRCATIDRKGFPRICHQWVVRETHHRETDVRALRASFAKLRVNTSLQRGVDAHVLLEGITGRVGDIESPVEVWIAGRYGGPGLSCVGFDLVGVPPVAMPPPLPVRFVALLLAGVHMPYGLGEQGCRPLPLPGFVARESRRGDA